jgi:hypothetical protein
MDKKKKKNTIKKIVFIVLSAILFAIFIVKTFFTKVAFEKPLLWSLILYIAGLLYNSFAYQLVKYSNSVRSVHYKKNIDVEPSELSVCISEILGYFMMGAGAILIFVI